MCGHWGQVIGEYCMRSFFTSRGLIRIMFMMQEVVEASRIWSWVRAGAGAGDGEGEGLGEEEVVEEEEVVVIGGCYFFGN